MPPVKPRASEASAPAVLSAGSFFLFQVGPFSLAIPIQAVVGVSTLLGTDAGLAPATEEVRGTVLFRKEEVPLVSLRPRLGLPEAGQANFAVVLRCHGAEIGIEVDALTESDSALEARLRPLPRGLSDLEVGLVQGWLTAGPVGAFLLDVEVLYTPEDLERIGEVLLG